MSAAHVEGFLEKKSGGKSASPSQGTLTAIAVGEARRQAARARQGGEQDHDGGAADEEVGIGMIMKTYRDPNVGLCSPRGGDRMISTSRPFGRVSNVSFGIDRECF